MLRGYRVNFQCRAVLLIWIIVRQGPTVLAVGASAGFLSCGIDWLVGCFGFRGPFKKYFSLYRAVS